MFRHTSLRFWTLGLIAALAIWRALTAEYFGVETVTEIAILAILVIALDMVAGFGGMVSVRMRGGAEAAHRLCSRTEVFILAESLGGVESLIEHPGAMTHASTAGSQLEVPADLVRLSVGIEDPADLLGDLEQALG